MLSQAQVQQYDHEGWLFLPAVFGEDEAATMLHEAQQIYAMDRQEVFREKDGKTARTAFAAHTYNETFRRLARHPRLIGPIEQVLRDKLYIHQFKLNAKAAFDGDQWQWHQDFGVWHRDDGMPEARAMNIAVFLDPVTEFNGPLMFIPQSHKKGVLEAGHDTSTTSYPLWTLDHATVRRLADQFGLVAPKGPAGSVLMFHGCLAHASPGNISPYDRTICYVTYCAVEEPHHELQAAGVDRASRLHADRAARRRLPRRADGPGARRRIAVSHACGRCGRGSADRPAEALAGRHGWGSRRAGRSPGTIPRSPPRPRRRSPDPPEAREFSVCRRSWPLLRFDARSRLGHLRSHIAPAVLAIGGGERRLRPWRAPCHAAPRRPAGGRRPCAAAAPCRPCPGRDRASCAGRGSRCRARRTAA